MTVATPSLTKHWVLPVESEGIPELLRRQPRWLCWRAGTPKPDGKFDKVPVDHSTARAINGRDEAHWRTFIEVMDAYREGVADGIGFALSDQHPVVVNGEAFYVTVADFDQCSAKMNEIRAVWLELGQPFVEVSPSNHGLHMWGLCCTPLRGGNAGDGKEIYSGGRFVTMTGVGAKGAFGECPGFVALEKRWFAPRAPVAGDSTQLPLIGDAGTPSNLGLGPSGDNWFDRLSPGDRNACLAEMLELPAVIALADTQDSVPSPNWRTVVAACARSGAPGAYDLCRAWAQTSGRFTPENFELRWRSYARG